MLIEAITQALRLHPEIELAIVFGSVARGRERPDSDVDLAVMGAAALEPGQKMALVSDVALATGRADLVDLRTAGEPLLGLILTYGERLLGTPQAYAQLLSRHLMDAEDFLPYVRRMLGERRHAWTGT